MVKNPVAFYTQLKAHHVYPLTPFHIALALIHMNVVFYCSKMIFC